MNDRNRAPQQSARFWKLVQSILAAAFGVQSGRRHEEDFKSSSPMPFILGGLLFTAIFVGSLILIVHLVLNGV